MSDLSPQKMPEGVTRSKDTDKLLKHLDESKSVDIDKLMGFYSKHTDALSKDVKEAFHDLAAHLEISGESSEATQDALVQLSRALTDFSVQEKARLLTDQKFKTLDKKKQDTFFTDLRSEFKAEKGNAAGNAIKNTVDFLPIIGPLQVLIKPLEQFLGFSFADKIGSAVTKAVQRKQDKKAERADNHEEERALTEDSYRKALEARPADQAPEKPETREPTVALPKPPEALLPAAGPEDLELPAISPPTTEQPVLVGPPETPLPPALVEGEKEMGPGTDVNPTPQKVLRADSAALGAVLIHNDLERLMDGGGKGGAKKEEDTDSMLDGVMGSLTKGGKLTKFLGALGLAGVAVGGIVAAGVEISKNIESKSTNLDNLNAQKALLNPADVADFNKVTAAISTTDKSQQTQGRQSAVTALSAGGGFLGPSDYYKELSGQAFLFDKGKSSAKELLQKSVVGVDKENFASTGPNLYRGATEQNLLMNIAATSQGFVPFVKASNQMVQEEILPNIGKGSIPLQFRRESPIKGLSLYSFGDTPLLLSDSTKKIIADKLVAAGKGKDGKVDPTSIYGMLLDPTQAPNAGYNGPPIAASDTGAALFDKLVSQGTAFKFHEGGKAYSEQLAVLRSGETVLNPVETKNYTRYLVDKGFEDNKNQLTKDVEAAQHLRDQRPMDREAMLADPWAAPPERAKATTDDVVDRLEELIQALKDKDLKPTVVPIQSSDGSIQPPNFAQLRIGV